MALEEPKRTAWIRTLQCCARTMSECEYGIEAHHAGAVRVKGRRPHDNTAIPLCRFHHDALHGLCNDFRGWERIDVRSFSDPMINIYREAYEETWPDSGREHPINPDYNGPCTCDECAEYGASDGTEAVS